MNPELYPITQYFSRNSQKKCHDGATRSLPAAARETHWSAVRHTGRKSTRVLGERQATPPDRGRCAAGIAICTLVLSLSLSGAMAGTAAQDVEASWAALLTPQATSAGELVWLETDADRALALWQPTTMAAPTKGGVILLHPMGGHPDWPEVIAPLRHHLPNYGWSTLAIQLPALPMSVGIDAYLDLIPTAKARIAAAVDSLAQRGLHNVVIVGYGLGAVMGAEFLADNASSGVAGFVAVSMISNPDVDPPVDSAALIKKVSVPILDIYAARDLDAVMEFNSARGRAAEIAAASVAESHNVGPFLDSATAQPGLSRTPGLVAYRQVAIPGADNSYAGQEDVLIKRIAGWLQRHAGGDRIDPTMEQ